MKEVKNFLSFRCTCSKFNPGVDVFRVFTENNHVNCSRIFYRRRNTFKPAHRTKTNIKVEDLAQRGLLEDTLVIWGGEFGRTPMGEVRDTVGRNHHIDCATMWFAGGGFRRGHVHGATDEFGHHAVSDKVSHHDLHATLLHLFGLDATKVTYKRNNQDLTILDNKNGRVVKEVLA